MSVNKWIGIGNVTKSPELKYTPSGNAVCNFSIACNERFKGRDGQVQESVEFVDLVAWKGLAEVCGKYLDKGKQIYIEGKLQSRTFDDRDGNKRKVWEVRIDQMQMLGSREGNQQTAERTESQNSRHSAPAQSDYPFDDNGDIPF